MLVCDIVIRHGFWTLDILKAGERRLATIFYTLQTKIRKMSESVDLAVVGMLSAIPAEILMKTEIAGD